MHAAINPCDITNGGCSHFCLLSTVDQRGYSCDCPYGMILGDDLSNCAPQSLLGINIGNNCVDLISEHYYVNIIFSGSCLANGYSSCCVNGNCQDSSSSCYCDANCHLFKDCCIDVPSDCKKQGIMPFLVL